MSNEPAAPTLPFPPAPASLRDWFAGCALSGLLANAEKTKQVGISCNEISNAAFGLADAMIARRGDD